MGGKHDKDYIHILLCIIMYTKLCIYNSNNNNNNTIITIITITIIVIIIVVIVIVIIVIVYLYIYKNIIRVLYFIVQ